MGDPFDPEFIKLLCCPKCRGKIEARQDINGFVCRKCKLLFKVKDGIPNFLIEEAQPLEEPNEGSAGK